MKIYEYVAKTLEEAKEKALKELSLTEEDIYIKESEESGGLFKGKKVKLQVITKDDIIEYSKEFIKSVTELMGINVNMEAKKRETYVQINMFSDNNPILIGKMGKTIESLQILIKSSIQNTTGFHVNIILDVENYKGNQQKNLEYNAKKLAYEVKRTGVEVKLDPMNSFERRIVHNICNQVGGVYTESVGEEPNRYVIIKKGEE
jgi:spoIIIJ-associated protein